ncbi:MAG: hypothetical protein EZS28_030143 [Streblomastix strix]|uniref:Uncharacterized protein n=1 Tax=Streblomastix strix TaxID=222440 RepID=A0A5J4UVZ8_9EUKA|nr:MAG: hypothetical protein EZS28_030143 [Streblomastix strix]
MPHRIQNQLIITEIKLLHLQGKLTYQHFTLQLAWELLVTRDYDRANILSTGLISRWQIDHAADVHNHHRTLGHVGRPSELWEEEEISLHEWISIKIKFKQYPTRTEIQDKAQSLIDQNQKRTEKQKATLSKG